MKKLSLFTICAVLLTCGAASAYSDSSLLRETRRGVDIIGAERNVHRIPDAAPGELGRDVYINAGAVNDDSVKMFIPTTAYVRIGGGLNLPFATDKAMFGGQKYKTSGAWTTQIGIGLNLFSYVRTELDFQESTFEFSDLDNMHASTQSLGGMLYFDLARRYVIRGDVTQRRTFVPYFGIGAGVANYKFDGAGGTDGVVVAAPRGVVGFNVMFTDIIGVDVYWQYQMLLGTKFGWNASRDTTSVSNIMAALRVNF